MKYLEQKNYSEFSQLLSIFPFIRGMTNEMLILYHVCLQYSSRKKLPKAAISMSWRLYIIAEAYAKK